MGPCRGGDLTAARWKLGRRLGLHRLRMARGEDSNPQRQGQNLLCCQLHHPRRARHPSAPVTVATPETVRPAIRARSASSRGRQAAVADDRGRRRRAPVSLTMCRNARSRRDGARRVGETWAVEAELLGDAVDARTRVVRVRHEQHRVRARSAGGCAAAAASDSHELRPLHLAQDRRASGTPVPAGSSRRRGRLGEAVARLLAAGHDDQRREPAGTARARGRAGPASTGDGRPSYWAAPSTTMASDRPGARRWRVPTTPARSVTPR